jgi:hypothetical protein
MRLRIQIDEIERDIPMNTKQGDLQTTNQIQADHQLSDPFAETKASHAERPHSSTISADRVASRLGWKKYAAIGLLLAAAFKIFGGGQQTWKGAENEAPNYQRHLAAASLPINLSSADLDQKMIRQAVAAVRSGTIPAALKHLPPALLQKVADGEVKFYSMRLWDTCTEDGDQIAVRLSNGMQFGPFPLTHEGKTLSIPVLNNAPPHIRLTAVKDGVGGVTVGVTTSDGVWYSNVLPVGSHQDIPTTLR